MPEDRHYVKCGGVTREGDACDATLAARVAGKLVLKRGGFEAIVDPPARLRCDRCGALADVTPEPTAQPREVNFTGPRP